MEKNQPRQPRGMHEGGQFAPQTNPESIVDFDERNFDARLTDPRDFMRERVEALREAGYVPATTAPLLVDPRSSAHRREWWDQHFAAGEYGHAEGGFAQMPDDWTPQHTPGHALSGARRTHRVAYVGSDVALRMPSASAIKSFAAANVAGKEVGETFDVPVSAQFPGGQFDGWVRVARGEDGTWATMGLGFTPEQSAYVAEAVQCVLESRRPSRALADVGDILERRRARAAERGAEIKPMNRSWIEGVGYDQASGTMIVETTTQAGRKVYGFEVSMAAFIRVANAQAPGRVFNNLVRGRATKVDVRECESCARRYVTPRHRCPVQVSARKKYLPGLAMVAEHLGRLR